MNKFYDRQNHRLVFIKNRANSNFWESHWDNYSVKQTTRPVFLSQTVIKPTKKYLGKGSRIIEGGCGLAQNVWALSKSGYDVYGVDYAEETVLKIKNAIPALKISYGDVRALDFKNDFFDGYWSLGVIEHFYDGFDKIASEMKRVIRPGGYLFLTFPCISRYRERKIKKGWYDDWKETAELLSNFYQFALASERVELKFELKGFKLVEKKAMAGFKGLKDELENLYIKRAMQKIYDSSSYLSKGLVWGAGKVLSAYAGHMQMLIFRNQK